MEKKKNLHFCVLPVNRWQNIKVSFFFLKTCIKCNLQLSFHSLSFICLSFRRLPFCRFPGWFMEMAIRVNWFIPEVYDAYVNWILGLRFRMLEARKYCLCRHNRFQLGLRMQHLQTWKWISEQSSIITKIKLYVKCVTIFDAKIICPKVQWRISSKVWWMWVISSGIEVSFIKRYVRWRRLRV